VPDQNENPDDPGYGLTPEERQRIEAGPLAMEYPPGKERAARVMMLRTRALVKFFMSAGWRTFASAEAFYHAIAHQVENGSIDPSDVYYLGVQLIRLAVEHGGKPKTGPDA
jgi:hypothetical protein